MNIAKVLSTLTDTLPSNKCFLTETRRRLCQQQRWSEIVDVTDAKGALPKLPGDQPGREQICSQCWNSEDQDTQTIRVKSETGTKVTTSGSCGFWSKMSTK